VRKLISIALAWLSWNAAGAELPADPGKTPAPLSLIVELTDGSRFIGTSQLDKLRFIAKYAEMNLAMKEVDSVTLGEDKETAKVVMSNGDNLQGVLDIGDLKLQTLLGELSVPIRHVSRITTTEGAIRRGLVLYYSFDDKEEIARDLSGKDNHGTLHGAKWVETGRFGGARSFSGNRELVIAKDPLPVMTTMSVSLWFKSLGATATTQVLITRWTPGPWRDGKWILCISNGTVWTWTHHSGRDPKQAGVIWQGIHPEDGKWHHVAMTIDDKEESLYFDGEKAPKTVPHPPATFRHSLPIKIGARWGNEHFRGLIDEVKIFNRALSAEEVLLLSKSP